MQLGIVSIPFFPLLEWRGDAPPPFSSPVQQSDGVIDATQQRVLDYISQHPGAHLRQICRELGLAMGDVQYHVYRLQKAGRINSSRRGFYRFFYASSLFGEKQRDILSVLSLDTPRELLLHIIDSPDSGQDELARGVGVSQPTISWHLKRLVELGIVEKRQVGKTIAYRVVEGSGQEIANFIRSYHPTVWEKWSSSLADIFISYGRSEEERR